MATDSEDGAGVEAATTLGIDRTAAGRPGHFGPDVIRAMEQVIVGQRYMLERLLIGLLADGHVLLEGVPGLAKTLAVKTLAQALDAGLSAHPVHARPAARRPDRHADLQAASGRVQRAQGADLRQPRARRRDQPRAGQGAERAARGDAGAAGHDRRRDLSGCRSRSSCSRRRTRSSRRAPTRCPRRRSTASCSRSGSATRRARRSARSSTAWRAPRAPPPDRSRSPMPQQIAARAPAGRPDLRRRQGQGLHRRPRVRDARARARTGSTSAAASSTAPRRARRSTSRWRPRPTRSCRAAATSRRRT